MAWQMRRDTATNWTAENPVLSEGEPGYDTTNALLKVGDGVAQWNDLEGISGVGSAGQATGTDEIADTGTDVAVAHGLGVIPETVLVTPRANEALWVPARDAVEFTVERAGTSGALTFDWLATGEEPSPPETSPHDLADFDASFWAEDLTLDDGDPVSQWDDGSGNGRHLTESGSNRPTLAAASAHLNSKPAVAFDGIVQRLSTTALSSSAPWEYVIVGRIANRTVAQKPFETGSGTTGTTATKRESNAGSNPNTLRSFSGSGPLENTAEPLGDTSFIAFVRVQSAGGLVRVRSVDATGNHGTRSLGNTTSLGRSHINNDGFTEMHVGFFGVRYASLTSDERANLEAWAESEYGVTLST